MDKIVLASGIFDILHPGHIFYLTQARKLGDKLIVLVTCDKVAKKQKRQPFFDQEDRRKLIESLKIVDEVIIGNENLDYCQTVREIKPDIIALGHDQEIKPSILADIKQKTNFRGEIVKIGKHPDSFHSTTLIINQISNRAKDEKRENVI
jgi:FAD synthetase